MTILSIERVSKLKGEGAEPSTRLVFDITTKNGTDGLWFQVEDAFADFIVDDRCDSAVVAVLALAIREGYSLIKSDLPMSRGLHENLVKHVIPQLCLAEGAGTDRLDLHVPVTDVTFAGDGIATGMSLGIDSFSTLYEYGRRSEAPEGARVTHLTYFDVGAHHGFDVRLGQSAVNRRELYEGQLERARAFAEEFDYDLVVVRSNLRTFLPKSFGRSQFYATHTYRNVAAVMVVQKLFRHYYYSAAYNLDNFALSLNVDSARYEKWLLPHLGTGSVDFSSSNRAWSRLEKTVRVASLVESYRYLTVCLVGVRNCGVCAKCERTLMALDALGGDVLNRFSESFDLERYRADTRTRLIQGIYQGMKRKGAYGTEMREIFAYGLRQGTVDIPEPPLKRHDSGTQARVRHDDVQLRARPHVMAPVAEAVSRGQIVESLGEFEVWTKISTGAVAGYVLTSAVGDLDREERAVGGADAHALREASFPEGAIGRTRSAIPLRRSPDADAGELARTRRDEPLVILGSPASGWLGVSNGTVNGYVPRESLRILEPIHAESGMRATLVETAELRARPTRQSEGRVQVAASAPVRVVHRVGAWYLVEARQGMRGYLPRASIRVAPGLVRRVRRKVRHLLAAGRR